MKTEICAITPMKRLPKQCNRCYYYDSMERYCSLTYRSLGHVRVSVEKPYWCPLRMAASFKSE